MSRHSHPVLIASLFVVAACTGSDHDHAPVLIPGPRPVSILVEVYDPVTNFVWENVSVRVAESAQEWSQCTCISPIEDWFATDGQGQVFLDEFDLAFADVGFLEDGAGRALLGSRSFEDEATVVLEIDAVGFSPVFYEVPLHWGEPDIFVQIPFGS